MNESGEMTKGFFFGKGNVKRSWGENCENDDGDFKNTTLKEAVKKLNCVDLSAL